MAVYELKPTRGEEPPQGEQSTALGGAVLLQNARWFIRLRWSVATVFAAAAGTGWLLPGLIRALGFVRLPLWSLILAGYLVATNLAFIWTVRRYDRQAPERTLARHLWVQIVSDLVGVTLMALSVGSTRAFIAFAYLFHIVLACIFFPPRWSLLVTALAAAFYFAAAGLELSGLWAAWMGAAPVEEGRELGLFNAAAAVFVWLVVWYLVSTLSEAVRRRDQQLRTANSRLMEADREKTWQVLRTTHDLKAPFAGIENNIQVLKLSFWEQLAPEVRKIIDRIEVRAQTLRERIAEILLLGNLRTQEISPEELRPVELQKAVGSVVEELAEKAAARKVAVAVQVPAVRVRASPGPLSVLLSNLLSNAVVYSKEGGTVEVSAAPAEGEITLSIADHGIGIKEEALTHIFDDYFRTTEAAAFNPTSTGLGLAIVREIARLCGLRIRVESEPGEGTTFRVVFPAA